MRLGVWRAFFVDNWYTDMPLAVALFEMKIYVIGTITLTKKRARSSQDFLTESCPARQ